MSQLNFKFCFHFKKNKTFRFVAGFGNEFFWTSGNDLGEEGKYVWASSGQKITFKNFLPGQPDNANAKEHCLELRNGGLWNDMVCDVKQFFVCQF